MFSALPLSVIVTLLLQAVKLTHQSTTNNNDAASHQIKRFGELCRDIDSIKHLSKMQELIDLLKKVLREDVAVRLTTNSTKSSFLKANLMKLFRTDPYKSCLTHQRQLLDLEPLITERKENLCNLNFIENLISYYKAHDLGGTQRSSSRQLLFSSHQTPIIKRFFHLFARQISFHCKRQLLHSLNVAADYSQAEEYELVKLLPWLDNSGSSSSSSQRFQCDAIKTLAGFDSLSSLASAMDKNLYIATVPTAARKRKFVVLSAADKEVKQTRAMSDHEEAVMSEKLSDKTTKENIKKVREICIKLQPIYSNTVLPLVRLMHTNLDADYPGFDERCQREQTIRRWLGITLVCDSILTNPLVNKSIEPTVVNHDIARVNSNGVPDYLANDADQLEDELWVNNYTPSSLSKYKDSFINTIMKTFKLDQLSENEVVNRGVNTAKEIVFNLVVVGISVAGLATNIRL